MIQAILLVCLPLFVALVGHSAYRVRKADRAHEARIDGHRVPLEDSAPAATPRE